MSVRNTTVLFLVAAALSLGADLASKAVVWRQLDASDEVVIVPGWVKVIQRLNKGGIWSLFHWADNANLWLASFGFLAVLAICAFAWSAVKQGQVMLPIVLGVILGGALGNLHDRFYFGGVRDWIDVHLQFYRWPTFNIADSFLVCGAIFLFLHSIFYKPQDYRAASVREHSAPDAA